MTLYICTAGTSIGGPPRPEMALEERIVAHVARKRAEHAGDARAFLIAVSAETNVLARRDCGPTDEVILIVTDTDDGRLAGVYLKSLIEETLGAPTRLEVISGLQVAREGEFRQEGLRNLIRKARAAAQEGRARGHEIVFNINGGYKGVIPYMTLLGMFEGVDILYVFQEIDALIRLPALPIRIDTRAIAAALPSIQWLQSATMVPEVQLDDLARRSGWKDDPMAELFFERCDGYASLSAAGELALEALDAEVAPAPASRVFCHRNTRSHSQNHLVLRSLWKIWTPGLRDTPLVNQTHPNSDFQIFKTIGSSAPRVFYWREDDAVFIADILSHTEYEQQVLRGPGLWRRDYARDAFDAMDLTDVAEVMAPDAYGEALAEFIAWADEARSDVAAKVSSLETGQETLKRRGAQLERRVERLSGTLDAVTSPLVLAAADFAAQAHRAQTRKDGVTPYVEHLRAVVRILAVEGGVTDPEIIAAGYLHDCIEDQGVTGETLEEMFGPRVRCLVEAVSDDKSLDKQARKDLQVVHARDAPADVALLKMADKIANLRDLVAAPPDDWSDARRAEYVAWASDVVAGLRGRGSLAHLKLERAFDEAADKARAALL